MYPAFPLEYAVCNYENRLGIHNIICLSYTACDQDVERVLWITVLNAQSLLVSTKNNPIQLSVTYPRLYRN